MVLTEAASNRAAMAILRVLSLGESFSAAAKAVGTTRRTMLNYVRENEVPIQRMNNGRWEVIKTASQKVPELLELMYEGESATRACRQLNTTVRTMSSQMLPDNAGVMLPVIIKEGNSWTPNFVGVREYSLTLHGQLLGFNDSVQGRGQLAGPDANQDEADNEYADIWWQVDFNNFQSALPIDRVGLFWQPEIMRFLRNTLELPLVSNSVLANRFLSNVNVANNAVSNDRVDSSNEMTLTVLEEFLERYDIRMSPDSTIGVEPARGLSAPIQFISVADMVADSLRTASGLWQVMFLTNANLEAYPIPVDFEYNLLEE
tara:strand:- start:1080 stop:2030 length:951 start_codon:yes stop_codon:yes gene_type:complete